MTHKPEKWIQNAIKVKNKGLLHAKLHVPAGEKIPLTKLKKAAKSKNPALRREAVFAETMRKLHHK